MGAVNIPDELYEKVREKAREAGFDDVDEYVTAILEEIVAELDEGSKEDEELVKQRLRELGYLE